MRRLLYWLSFIKTLSYTLTNPPFFVCKVNLHSPQGLHEARPAELASCNPWGECKFTLQTKKGGLVRVYDSVLMNESQYKSLLISEDTTVEEVVRILFHCYGLEHCQVSSFSLYEHCKTQNYERKLNCSDRPLSIQDSWLDPAQFRLVLRRTPGQVRK